MYLNDEITTLMLKRKYCEFKQQYKITSTWLEYEEYAFNGIFEQQSQFIRNSYIIPNLIRIDLINGCDICHTSYVYYKYILEHSLFAYWNNVNEIQLILMNLIL